uniref:Abasic site processing protein HMCES n=1 Tax=Rhipicephalus microplus TaxID=6941 RepID=A0A6M2D0F3_RHIMP
MCGRTACSLSKECLSFACMYQDPYGLYQPPEWCDDVGGTCEPSYNIAPTSYCPVLVDHSKLEDGMPPKRVLAPMRWGLLPSWYQGGLADFKLNTFNCRVEGCQRRNCYQPAIASGRRCVVLAEGYFEWKKPSSGEKKEPYFVYFKQPAGISMVTRDWDCDGKENLLQGGCWRGPKLLTMAGIFDKNAGVYSFSILTMRAPEYMAWLHDRVPVVLEEEAVNAWLDPVHDTMQLIQSVHFPSTLDWHQVGSQVGNTRNKGMDCVLPVKKTESKQKRSVLDAWLLKVTTEKAGPSTSTSTRSQSPLNAEPKDEPALQVKEEPGPQGAVVQVKEEPGVQEAASEEKQEGSAQGKEAPVQQPATEMKVEAKELVNAESVMQLKEEGGAQQQKKRRLD